MEAVGIIGGVSLSEFGRHISVTLGRWSDSRSTLVEESPVPFLHSWDDKFVVGPGEDVAHDRFDAGENMGELDRIVNVRDNPYPGFWVGKSDAGFVAPLKYGIESLLVIDCFVFYFGQ